MQLVRKQIEIPSHLKALSLRRTALAVVDLQPNFFDRFSDLPETRHILSTTISRIVDHIHRVKSMDRWIYLVEYKDYGPTIPTITSAVGAYSKVARVVKTGNCGAMEILETPFVKAERINSFVVVGAFLEACVAHTALGLEDYGYRAHISIDACVSFKTPGYSNDVASGRTLKNIIQ